MMMGQERVRLIHYPARYTRIPAGCLGRLAGWPEAATGGQYPEDCRALLRDALQEMIPAHRQQGREIPPGHACLP